jgi:hypothetical protein
VLQELGAPAGWGRVGIYQTIADSLGVGYIFVKWAVGRPGALLDIIRADCQSKHTAEGTDVHKHP